MVLNKEELRRLQSIEVDMLKEFVRICNELRLKYYVIDGTLLGAVRHNGFIPWDDDIDVGMPRKDYEVFLKKAPEMLAEGLFLQNNHTDKEYCLNMSKIRNVNTTFIEKECRRQNIRHGVFIDIVPLDNYPLSFCSRLWLDFKRKILGWRIGKGFVWEVPNPIKRMVKELMYACLSLVWTETKEAVEAREKLFSSFPYTGLIVNFSCLSGKKDVIPAEWYGEGCDLDFEGIKVRAPKEYHKWLTQVYGDYMKLPPKEKQVAHHHTTIIDLDHPYTDYLE